MAYRNQNFTVTYYTNSRIVGRTDFSDQFRKIIIRYKHIGYNSNAMRQPACLAFNLITVNNYASLFNCTPVGRASDSMMAQTFFVCCLVHQGSTGDSLLLQIFKGVV